MFLYPVWRQISGIFILSLLAQITAAAAINGDYSLRAQDEIICLNINQTGSRVSGFAQFVVGNRANPSWFQATTQRLSGNVDGHRISLDITDFPKCEGRYSSTYINVQIPLSSGALSALHFAKTSAKAWNLAVLSFEKDHMVQAEIHRFESCSSQEYEQNQTLMSSLGNLMAETARKEQGFQQELSIRKARVASGNEAVVKNQDRIKLLDDKLIQVKKNVADLESQKQSSNDMDLRQRLSDAKQELESVMQDKSSAQQDLKSSQEDVEGYAKDVVSLESEQRLFEKGQNTQQLQITYAACANKILETKRCKFKFLSLAKGRLFIGKTNAPCPVFDYPLASSGPKQTIPKGVQLEYLAVDSRWYIVLFPNGIEWVLGYTISPVQIMSSSVPVAL